MLVAQDNVWSEGIREQVAFLRELNDVKRLRAKNLEIESFTSFIFRSACVAVVSGEPLRADMWCAAVVSSARLGAITPMVLRDIGLNASESVEILSNSISAHESLPAAINDSLVAACRELKTEFPEKPVARVDWVERLVAAPRAGATCPGKPRIVLEPAEMHGDHCAMVAVYGYLLADHFGADREDAWLIGLCHHFHNAYLPDAGFTGEMLLGDHLHRVLANLRHRVIDTLPDSVQRRVAALFEEIADVATPLAKTFHAADTIDRVLQMEYYERSSQFRVRHALLDLNLVHEGAAQEFQYGLLQSIGLFPDLQS